MWYTRRYAASVKAASTIKVLKGTLCHRVLEEARRKAQ